MVDGLNAVDKRYIYQLISTVKLPGSKKFDSKIQIHTVTKKYDVILAKEFQEHLTKKHHKDGVIDQGKSKKIFMERKWTERQYNVQDNADVEHKDVKMYCNTNQFPYLSICGPHSKPHYARGLSHRWELPGNYPFFTIIMVIYRDVERIWIILVTPFFITYTMMNK